MLRSTVPLALALLLAAPLPAAAQAYLQNDTFTGSGQVNASASFEGYQAAAVIVGGNYSNYPVAITGIAVFYPGASGNPGGEPYFVEVYSHEAVAGGLPSDPSVMSGDIYSDRGSGNIHNLQPDNSQFNEIDFPSPVTVDGPIFVWIQQAESYGNDGFYYEGTIALDPSTPAPGTNYWWAEGPPSPFYADLSAPDSGYPSGNWIIRGIIDTSSGTTTTTSSTTTSATSTTSTSATGSTSTSSTSGSTGTTSTASTSSNTSSSSGAGSTSGTTTTATGTTTGTATGTTTGGTTTGGTTSTGTTSTGTTSGGTTTGGTTTTGGSLSLVSISPAQGYASSDTAVILTGSNFQLGIQALIGPKGLTDIALSSPAVLNGTLSHGAAPGTYDVTVVNPDGAQATLHGAFTVLAGSPPDAGTSGGSGGSAGDGGAGTDGAKSGGCGCTTTTADLWLLPFALLALRARRRSVH